MNYPMKPCPFCGGEPNGIKYKTPMALGGAYTYTVLCTRCFSMSGKHHTEQEAADAWNRRDGENHDES